MDGVAVKPLTVGFHETEFLEKLNSENQRGFWFQLSDDEQEQVASSWGPSDPQALNRYSYVRNRPLVYTDPTGHVDCASGPCAEGGGGGRGTGGSGGGRGSGSSGGSSGGAPRGGNRPAPDSRAEGPHSVLHRDPRTGEVTKYTTFEPQTNPQNPNSWMTVKRYRADGGTHYNKVTREDVKPPLVHDRTTPGGVRAPRADEIPGGPR